jgi:hypothetical protein
MNSFVKGILVMVYFFSRGQTYRLLFDRPVLSTVLSFDRLRTNGVEGMTGHSESREARDRTIALSPSAPMKKRDMSLF